MSATNSKSNVYPLAFPKGVKYACELCQKSANRICDKCRVTFYCDDEHQESDWYGIHEKICQALIPLRSPQPFLPSEDERKSRDIELHTKKVQLIEYTRSISEKFLFEGDYIRSIPGAMASLRFSIELFGLKSVELVPSYLILGEANLGLGNIVQAQEYLSQAEWTVVKNTNCPLSILSKMYRKIAMLQIAKGELEDALRNLANDIYFSSAEYGVDDIRVSGGYYLMANIFFKQEKFLIADSLYRQVSTMWYAHLSKVVDERTKITELDTILGKKEEENDGEVIELATEAEARKVLYAIHDLRKNETKIDSKELYQIEHCLSMVHFLTKEYDKTIDFASLLSSNSEVTNEMKNHLHKMITFINMK